MELHPLNICDKMRENVIEVYLYAKEKAFF